MGKDGFPRCEKCKKKVPKIQPDHIVAIGEISDGFIGRLFCPSKFLKALCPKCHREKTALDRKRIDAEKDFF